VLGLYDIGHIVKENSSKGGGRGGFKPFKADSHFFWPILLKLAGAMKNGKNRIPLFFVFL
jgi:hypothetical protein